MKIQFCSDLHLEFEENRNFLRTNPLRVEGDVLVIAGDIGYLDGDAAFSSDFIKWAADNYRHVLMTPGNHEYYRQGDLGKSSGGLEKMFYSNLGYYHNRVVRIDDVDFIMSTLWTRIPTENEKVIRICLNDYYQIRYNGRELEPREINREFEKNLSFIERAVKESTADKIVVVTHHLPTFEALLGRKRNDVLNKAYATELSDYIAGSRITAWIYGHSHFATDLIIGNSRLVSNPLGYVRYGEHLDFDNGAVLEL